MKTAADHNARCLNLFSLCHGAIFILPVLLPYYHDQLGLGFRELMMGEALFAATILFAEVPTGWLADRWKRKFCLALAGLTGAMGYVILSQADGFAQTMVAHAIIGLSISLVSGTQSALHFDSLRAEGRIDEYRVQEGRRHGLGLMSVGVSALLGGFLYEIHPELPILCTIIATICMSVIALSMKEPPRTSTETHGNPFISMVRTVRYALHGHREIAEIIFVSAALFSATKMMMWAQQPYYLSIGLDEKWFGVLMACGFLGGAAASRLGHLLDHRFRNRTVLLAMITMVIVICAASAWLHNLGGALLLLAGSLFWGMGWPRVQDAINRRTESGNRASVLSTASLMIHLFFIPLSLVLGAMTDRFDIQAGVLCLIVVPMMAGLLLAGAILRTRRKSLGFSGAQQEKSAS